MTLDGDQVPMDALDHARALMAGIEAHPNDRAALDAVRDVLTRMDEVAAEAPIPWTTWAEHPDPPSPRRWLVRDWLPAGRVALLTGPGGVGKSRLVLQLAAGIASGGGQGDAWIDTPDTDTLRLGAASRSEGDCVVYASWEDEPEEIYRRLAQVSGDGAPWVTPDRLRGLHLVDMAGMGPIWAPDAGRHISTIAAITPAGQRLRRHCEENAARLLILDPLAAAYAGDENARGLVRAFVADWDAWGRANDCAVILVAHPPKSGATFAGSTDWQGAVRAMWMLVKDKRGAKTGDDNLLTWKLSLEKSNYGPEQEPLHLGWDTAGGGLRWQALGLWKDDGAALGTNGAGRGRHDFFE